MSIPTAIQAKEAKGTKEVKEEKEYGDSEVTLHNELKHKSIFLKDFTTAAQMLRQVLRRCFGRCCAGGSTGAAQVLRQVLYRCFGSCCADASAVAAQVLRQVLRPGCERCLACGHRSGVECRDKGNGWRGR